MDKPHVIHKQYGICTIEDHCKILNEQNPSDTLMYVETMKDVIQIEINDLWKCIHCEKEYINVRFINGSAWCQNCRKGW